MSIVFLLLFTFNIIINILIKRNNNNNIKSTFIVHKSIDTKVLARLDHISLHSLKDSVQEMY